MRKGVDGFENVTAINSRFMNERPFVFEVPDAKFAATSLLSWKLNATFSDITEKIIDDVTPRAFHETITQRRLDEQRLKRLSVLEREEQRDFHEPDAITDQLEEALAQFDESAPEYAAINIILIMHKAQLRGDNIAIDPLLIVAKIVRLSEQKAS